MNLLHRALSNAWDHLNRSRWVHTLCLGIITFTLLIAGVFEYVSANIRQFTNRYTQSVEAIFYLLPESNASDAEQLRALLSKNHMVEDVVFTSRDQAVRDFAHQFPDLSPILEEFPQSPFPASLTVHFRQGHQESNSELKALIDQLGKHPLIESRQVNLDWADRLMSIRSLVRLIGLFLTTVLILVSAFIIFSVIKMSIFTRREEIRILSLVGATEGYIRTPFLIEGALLGGAGGILASIILWLASLIPLPQSSYVFAMLSELMVLSSMPLHIALLLTFLGLVVGLLSALFSLRSLTRHLF